MKKKSKGILTIVAVGLFVMCFGLIYGGVADSSFAEPAYHEVKVNDQKPTNISADGKALFEIKEDGKTIAKVIATGGEEDNGAYVVEHGDMLEGTVTVENGYGIKHFELDTDDCDIDSECEQLSFKRIMDSHVSIVLDIQKKYGITIRDAKRVKRLSSSWISEYVLNSKQATFTINGDPCNLLKNNPSQFEDGNVYIDISPKKGYYFRSAYVDGQKYTESWFNFKMPAKNVEIKNFDLGRDDTAPVVKGIANGKTYSVQDINDGGGIIMEDTASGLVYYEVWQRFGDEWVQNGSDGWWSDPNDPQTVRIDKSYSPWNGILSSDVRISVYDRAGNQTTVDFTLSDIVEGSCQHDWSGAWTSVDEFSHKKTCSKCNEECVKYHDSDYQITDNGTTIIEQCKICGYSRQNSSGDDIKSWAGEYNNYILMPLTEDLDEAYAAAENAIDEANAALQKALASGTAEDARIAEEKAKTASSLAAKANTILKTIEDSADVLYNIMKESYDLSGDPELLELLSDWQESKNGFMSNEMVQDVKTGNIQTQAQTVEQKATAHKKAIEKPTIGKMANTLTAKGKAVTVKHKKLKKKTQSIKRTKAITVKKAQGKVTYKKVSVGSKKVNKKYGKKIIINKKTGKITVKKGLKKGTYKVKIKVTAAGNANYYAATKTVTVKIRVK